MSKEKIKDKISRIGGLTIGFSIVGMALLYFLLRFFENQRIIPPVVDFYLYRVALVLFVGTIVIVVGSGIRDSVRKRGVWGTLYHIITKLLESIWDSFRKGD